MENLTSILNSLSGFIWGPTTLVLLIGVGIYLSIGLKFMPWTNIPFAFKQLFKGRESSGEGEISPFQALMTAMSATVGTGNIAGVATAIVIGGPGAIFWMWVTALLGMATKYGEAVLAVKFRETDELGKHVGGPMYYIKNGLGPKWAWLGFAFALFGTIAAFGIGNMVQSNSVAAALHSTFDINKQITGAVIAVLAGIVILGGIKRVGNVAGKLVPFMAIVYIAGSLFIIISNLAEVPAAFDVIIDSAFNGHAAAGGFAGATVLMAIQKGVARGIFSNEAGLGSAPIAHAAAQTDNPVRQGLIGMLGTFIDTIIICTMTALVIIMSGVWTSGETGATLSSIAYGNSLPYGEYIITFGLVVFAFTTILGWSYYGERCAEFIFGAKIIMPYRVLWIIAAFFGATQKVNFIWILADVMNGLMALPNLIALLLLSPVIFAVTRKYFAEENK